MAWMKPAGALGKLPELLIRGRFPFNFDGVPLIAEGLSFRKRANLLMTGVDMFLGFDRSHALPSTIQVEPTNTCNLKCPLCPTGIGSMKRPKGFMTLETFTKIIDEIGDVLLSVFLYGWGEPFLNRDLPRMMETCTKRNIRTLSNTNGHFLQTPDEALRIVDAGLSALIIAVDGSTQEIYQRYRKSGDIEKVKRCIANIEEAKEKRGAQMPYTNFRVVVTHDNEDDLPALEKLARDLGVNMFSYKPVGMLTGAKKFEDYVPAQEEVRRFKYRDSIRLHKPPIWCPFPFRQPTIFWDGTVEGCEYDYVLEASFGKVGTQTFRSIWNSKEAIQLRRRIRKGLPKEGFCRLCPYQDRIQDSSVLLCKELRPAGSSMAGCGCAEARMGGDDELAP
jgi:MoaA/NifB/PqqE/SkfB family radical SAM enzyme